jgi:hypothetical protein
MQKCIESKGEFRLPSRALPGFHWRIDRMRQRQILRSTVPIPAGSLRCAEFREKLTPQPPHPHRPAAAAPPEPGPLATNIPGGNSIRKPLLSTMLTGTSGFADISSNVYVVPPNPSGTTTIVIAPSTAAAIPSQNKQHTQTDRNIIIALEN